MLSRVSFLKRLGSGFVGVILVACAAAQNCPPLPQLQDHPWVEYQLEGFIGKKAARMSLTRGGNAVTGVFYFTADWRPVLLGGSWSGNASILMGDESDSCSEDDCFGEGILRGTVNAEGFEGTWQSDPQSKPQKVRMRKYVGDRCSARGPMGVFGDPRWPITFSYPSAWHLQVAANTITLTCPDPSLMAYDGMQITITRGTGRNPESFSFCGGKWWWSRDCSCEANGHCAQAAVTSINGMKLISKFDGAERLYCRSGGYVGEGDASHGAFLLDDRWIEFEGYGPLAAEVAPILRTVRKSPDLGLSSALRKFRPAPASKVPESRLTRHSGSISKISAALTMSLIN